MQSYNQMLDNLYAPSAEGFEKTAEDAFASRLRGTDSLQGNPLASLSTADLERQLAELEQEKIASEVLHGTPEDLVKTAAEVLGGQIMAHAFVHETELIKVAMQSGICRICKEAPVGGGQGTVCAACS